MQITLKKLYCLLSVQFKCTDDINIENVVRTKKKNVECPTCSWSLMFLAHFDVFCASTCVSLGDKINLPVAWLGNLPFLLSSRDIGWVYTWSHYLFTPKLYFYNNPLSCFVLPGEILTILVLVVSKKFPCEFGRPCTCTLYDKSVDF